MFQRLSGLVAEQAEVLAHIEDNIDDAGLHIDEAQSQLQKYYRNIRNNRGLIIKAFIVLFIVIALWSFLN